MASPTFEAFIGPAFVIICVAFMMYGTFCAQVWYYWATYNDRPALQYLVGILTAMETAHTALCIHVLYEYLVRLWGNAGSAGEIISTVTVAIYFELIISSVVQAWYIYRIWRLRRQAIPTAFLAATLLAHIAISFRASAYTHKYATWEELYNDAQFSIDVNCTFGLNIALDASITSVLMFYLLRDRSKAIKRSTKRMIKSLLHFAFSTGILTVLTSCGLFVALNVAKHTLTFGGMIQFIAKLYANSMLAVLNARRSVAKAATADTKFGVELSNLQSSSASTPVPTIQEPIHFQAHTTALGTSDNTWTTKQSESDPFSTPGDPPGIRTFEVVTEKV